MKRQPVAMAGVTCLLLAAVWPIARPSTAQLGETMAGPASQGRGFVVSPDGDDQHPGTVLQPWRTLTKASQTVRPGDTVFIRKGEDPAGVVLRRSGETGRPITFRNFPGERPIINGRGRSRYGLVLDQVRFVHVRGLEIREIQTLNPRRRDILHEQGGILLRESSDCVVEGNLIVTGGLPGYTEENPGATGIQLWSRNPEKGCHRNLIRGNNISKAAYAVHVRGPGRQNVFEGNYWHDNQEMREHSDCIKFESIDYDRNHPRKYVESYTELAAPEWASHTSRENVIRYNLCESNSDDGIDTWISVRNLIEYNFCQGSGHGPKQGDGNGFKLGPGGYNTIRFNLSRNNRVKAYTDNGGLNNVYENNLALGEKTDGGKGVLRLRSTDDWRRSKLRELIEEKIVAFRAILAETTPPRSPRNVRRLGGRLSWQAPVPAKDGDGAVCYLIVSNERLVGITLGPPWEAPAGVNGNLAVVAVDDSYGDNRSRPAAIGTHSTESQRISPAPAEGRQR